MSLTQYLAHPQYACPGETMLQVLKTSLNPNRTNFRLRSTDPILVSIDIGVGSKGSLETIGIAQLDTRFGACENTISTTLLLLRRRRLPSNTRIRQYIFGVPEYSPPEATHETLQTRFNQPDQEHPGQFRNIFLVGHNVRSDMKYLKDTIAFDAEAMSTVVAIIDTQQLAWCVFKSPFKYMSLKQTLATLGIQARQLHNSGNDAVYTLVALLRLFCIYQTAAMGDNSETCVGPPSHELEQPSTMLRWRERLDLLKQTADRCRPVPRPARRIRPPRVQCPDSLDIEMTSDGETDGTLINIFADGP